MAKVSLGNNLTFKLYAYLKGNLKRFFIRSPRKEHSNDQQDDEPNRRGGGGHIKC